MTRHDPWVDPLLAPCLACPIPALLTWVCSCRDTLCRAVKDAEEEVGSVVEEQTSESEAEAVAERPAGPFETLESRYEASMNQPHPADVFEMPAPEERGFNRLIKKPIRDVKAEAEKEKARS